MKIYFLPVIALGCIAFSGFHLARSYQPRPLTEPPFAPAKSPFDKQVAGLGIVESRTENIAIGSHFAGVVDKVFVKEGECVQAGAPLFELDTRQVMADVRVKESMLAVARAQLAKLESMPRPEELPAMEAQVAEMQALVTQKEDTLRAHQAFAAIAGCGGADVRGRSAGGAGGAHS